MFTQRNVWMVIKAAKLAVVEDDKGVEHRMAECQLVIDPLDRTLAHELGEDIASHFFTEAGALRPELNTITLDPRVPNQMMTARPTVDSREGRVIRDVEVLALTVAKQVDEKSGKEWLKATFRVRFDFAPKTHREWIAMYFGYGQCFSFDAEQLSLDDIPAAINEAIARTAENPGQEFVDKMRAMGSDVELTTVVNGRRVGTRITQDTVEAVDRPAAGA